MTRGGRRRPGGGARRPHGGRRRPEPGARREPGGLGGEQVEGRRAVLELLTARRRRVRQVWMAGELDPSPLITAIRQEAGDQNVPVSMVTGAEIAERARTDAPQGVVARADALRAADADELFADPRAFVVALDGVTDPGNVGAALRSAEGAGATGVLLPKRRSAHVTPAAAKAAAGAVEWLSIALVPGIPAALERAQRAGLWTVGLDGDGDTDVFDLAVADRPLVLVLGAEGRGLARLTRERCDVVARIPMLGRLESLNVAAAATLACYEVARARR